MWCVKNYEQQSQIRCISSYWIPNIVIISIRGIKKIYIYIKSPLNNLLVSISSGFWDSVFPRSYRIYFKVDFKLLFSNLLFSQIKYGIIVLLFLYFIKEFSWSTSRIKRSWLNYTQKKYPFSCTVLCCTTYWWVKTFN